MRFKKLLCVKKLFFRKRDWKFIYVVTLTCILMSDSALCITKRITVDAKNCCQLTGVIVSKGDMVKISAFGDWGLCDYNNHLCRSGPGGSSHWGLPKDATAKGLPLGVLIGSIGSGPFFGIGSSLSFVATMSGELKLGMNDAKGAYGDNVHSLIVIVEVNEGLINQFNAGIKILNEQQKSLVGLFANGMCPEGWTKTQWPYRKPINNCASENCEMVSVKELPGYIACEKIDVDY